MMICLGTLIEVEAMSSIENDMLVIRYLDAFIDDDNKLVCALPEINERVRNCFGSHLSVKYGDPKTRETYDEPCGTFLLTLVSDSYFYSKVMQ